MEMYERDSDQEVSCQLSNNTLKLIFQLHFFNNFVFDQRATFSVLNIALIKFTQALIVHQQKLTVVYLIETCASYYVWYCIWHNV